MSEGISHASIRFNEGGRLKKKKIAFLERVDIFWKVKVSLFSLIGFCTNMSEEKAAFRRFFKLFIQHHGIEKVLTC